MKKILSLVFVLFLFFLAKPVLAQQDRVEATTPVSAEQIDVFDTSIKVNIDGSINVREMIAYNFGTSQKHGIYRTIPVNFKNYIGNLSTAISDVSVVDEKGDAYQFTQSTSGSNFNIKIGDPNQFVTGLKIYVVSYKLDRAINFFKDHDEIYWNVTGNGWTVPILRASAIVVNPNKSNNIFSAACYVGEYGSKNSCTLINKAVNSTIFAEQNLQPGAGLTIVVGFPKGIIIEPTLKQKLGYILKDNWILVLPILVFVLMYLLWYKKGRDPKISKVVVAEYEAPNNLTPAQVAEIVKFKEPSTGLTAEIIELAVRGYLQINKVGKDYQLIKLKDADLTLTDYQNLLISELFVKRRDEFEELEKMLPGKTLKNVVEGIRGVVAPKHPESVKGKPAVMLSDLQDEFYTTAKSINKLVTKSLITQGYFDADPISVQSPYIIIGGLLIFLGIFLGVSNGLVWFIACGLAGLIICLFGSAMPRRTQAGAEALRKILGLKLYLSVAEEKRMNYGGQPEKTPARFEKLLPYAVALGVEKQWAKQFEGIYTQPPKWYNDNYSTFNAVILANSLHNFHSVSHSALSSAPSSASSGGSGFSGGGSGGGFGGGGGGSW